MIALMGALLGAAGDLSIDFTSEGQRILGLEGSVDDLRYANGPLLVAPLGASRRVHFCPIDFQKSLLNFELFFSVVGVWVGLRQPAGQKSFSCPKNRRGLNEAKKRL